ncbi:MAG: M20/M25/M40 family metallo-hydrolase, partial [Bacteroidaceae bacterium]|nr:M20/M25/M40 family metallo-hydrolase [Bacteroidaceae bacterium]
MKKEALFKQYTQESIDLLKQLVATPSHSRDETAAADIFQQFCEEKGLCPQRYGNNIVLCAPTPATASEASASDKPLPSLPTLLLNAHIDTVKPSSAWTKDPYSPTVEGDCIYGLGANDCGGGLVALLAAYRILTDGAHSSAQSGYTPKYRLVFVASAEEEVSGSNGFEYVRQFLPKIDVAIVGEPTAMHPAIAEKGLMVVDMTSRGKPGHAARNEGVNAIYEALDDIQWVRDYRFGKVSPLLGPVKMSLTVIHAGSQHNVVPDKCEMVIDVRTNELYTNEEVLAIMQQHCRSELKARSTRLSSSSFDEHHPFVCQLKAMGKVPYGSPTLSDQALMPWPSLKLGPGDSARSHTADE